MKCQYRNACKGKKDAQFEVIPQGNVCAGCLECLKRIVFKLKKGVVNFRLIGTKDWKQYGYQP